MVLWNYRVIYVEDEEDGEDNYAIHQVFYNDLGQIKGWTNKPVACFGEEIAELRSDLHRHHNALQRPVLYLKTVNGKERLVESNAPLSVYNGHYFEFADRAHVALTYLEEFLGTSPILQTEEGLARIYKDLVNAATSLYEEAMNLDLKRLP